MNRKIEHRYSEAIRLQIRDMYRSGRFGSLLELHTYCKENNLYVKMPSIRIINDWMKEDGGWQKGENAPKIEAQIKKNTEEILAELGMPKEEALRLLVDTINNVKDSPVKLLPYLQEYNKIVGQYAPTKQEKTVKGRVDLDEDVVETRIANKMRVLHGKDDNAANTMAA